jgi:hypothetical protein
METQTQQTTDKVEAVTTEAQAVVPPPAESETEAKVEQLSATVAVEPTPEKPADETASLVPAVLAVVAAVVGLVAVLKKVFAK